MSDLANMWLNFAKIFITQKTSRKKLEILKSNSLWYNKISNLAAQNYKLAEQDLKLAEQDLKLAEKNLKLAEYIPQDTIDFPKLLQSLSELVEEKRKELGQAKNFLGSFG